jgi:acyl CoA:acetate/3-ketoacid CoA transferase beta subunit
MGDTVSFTDTEHNICVTSRLLEEDRLYWVAIGGPPLVAIRLAKATHAPKIAYVVEDGTIAPEPPADLPLFMLGGSAAAYRAVAWTDMNTVGLHAALGYLDYGVLAAVQVDEFGNFNSTFVGGTYDRPHRRFGGPGGANEIASMCWRTILMTKLQRRKFVRKLDFMSSPGFLDGSPRARERAGLPADSGPYRVVTEDAVFGFDDETRRMTLVGLSPWATVESVRAKMEFEPLLAPQLQVVPPPTEEELAVLRSQVDVSGRTIGRGEWLHYDPRTSELRREGKSADD